MIFQHRRKIHPLIEVKFHERTAADRYEIVELFNRLKGDDTQDTEKGAWVLRKKSAFAFCVICTDEMVGVGDAADIKFLKVTSRSSDQELVDSFKWFMTELPEDVIDEWIDAVAPPEPKADDPNS